MLHLILNGIRGLKINGDNVYGIKEDFVQIIEGNLDKIKVKSVYNIGN
jgi:hypothetical protein